VVVSIPFLLDCLSRRLGESSLAGERFLAGYLAQLTAPHLGCACPHERFVD
jgi:hypothetical protein